MSRLKLSVAGLLLLTVASWSKAEENNPAGSAALAAQFVGEETLLVMRISARSTEVDRIFDAFGNLFPLPPEARSHLDEEKASVVRGLQKLENAGGKDYFIAGPPFVIFCSLAPNADHTIIARMFPPQHVVEMRGNVLVDADGREAMDTINSMTIVERPELRAAFAVAGDGYAQFVLLPPRLKKPKKYAMPKDEELSEVVAALLHSDSTDNPFDKMAWAAVGVDLHPDARIRLTIQCKGADDAKQLSAAWQTLLRKFAKDHRNPISAEEFETLIPALQPEIEKDRLVWSVNERSKQWSALLKFVSVAIMAPAEEKTATE